MVTKKQKYSIPWSWILAAIVFFFVTFIIVFDVIGVKASFSTLVTALISIVVVSAVIAYFYISKSDTEGENSDVLSVIEKIKKRWNEGGNEKGYGRLSLDENFRAKVKTFEANNVTYRALRFFLNDSPLRVTNVLIVWNENKGIIDDIDFDPHSERLADPFKDFNPIEGKYRIQQQQGKLKLEADFPSKTVNKTDLDIGEEENESK